MYTDIKKLKDKELADLLASTNAQRDELAVTAKALSAEIKSRAAMAAARESVAHLTPEARKALLSEAE